MRARPVSQTAPPAPASGVATVREIAAFLKVSTDTVYRMVNDNEIKSFRVRTGIRIPWSAVHEL